MTSTLVTREALLKAIDAAEAQLGQLHNQINMLAEIEAQAAQSGSTSTSHQTLKDQLIKAGEALNERAHLLHAQLCNLA